MGTPGPHYTGNIGTRVPVFPRNVGTQVPILPGKWGLSVPILGGPHFHMTLEVGLKALIFPERSAGLLSDLQA